jgi:tetratricopeptide (TPR) repeat protein
MSAPAITALKGAQRLAAGGRLREAAAACGEAARGAPPNALFWDALGTTLSRAGEQRRALEAYRQALELSPDDPRILFNRAAVCRFLGELAQAEEDYDRVIRLDPEDWEAYKNRSDLRMQTAQRNHVAELEFVLARRRPPWSGEVALRYALAKECEDLGLHARAFEDLARGARLHREHLRYDVATDEQTADWIIEAFGAVSDLPPPGASGTPPPSVPCAEAPIFIVGLPRSGSTLVDRILDSHPDVSSAGELPCFTQALVAAVPRGSDGRPPARRQLIAQAAELDFAALGRDYLHRARSAGAAAGRFTDKMPLNYLYCGLIRRALPHARIVHVTRSPMAACYAMYKTLFNEGYPYSYDQAELGRYYAAYRRLMAHWHSTLRGAILEVRYEALVADQEGETRRLLQFCGLRWHAGCLDFHANPSPVTTASAAQVRRPLYDSAIVQWRHYEEQLAPLARALAAAGLEDELTHEPA